MARTTQTLLASIVACAAAQVAAAQTPPPAPPPVPQAPAPLTPSDRGPDAEVEAYLERLGLKGLLAEQLYTRVRRTDGPERQGAAERLAKLYVDLLTGASAESARRAWEDKSRELLRLVPESDSFDLRLNLARVLYGRAEDALERARLRMATAAEIAEAERSLRSIKPEVADVASKVHRRVEMLERAQEVGKDSEEVREELATSRRLRSEAFYYQGWADYYLALQGAGSDKLAADAMKSFGWLLNARGGVPASLERFPAGLLKYEHIARAAMGCGMCAALRGNDVEAVRWLDSVEYSPDTPPAVKEQLLPRRITVLAGAKRWADLERLIRVTRRSDRAGGGPGVQTLTPAPARLLAVIALEADKKLAGEIVDRLAQIALADLVARGEVAHVMDLVKLYGTAPIGETGFIVHYVRGLQAYEGARASHKAAGGDQEEPAADATVRNAYRAAAGLLAESLRQPDAATFGAQRARVALTSGLALYYGGETMKAAERFMVAAKGQDSPQPAEEALWLAIVSMDRAVTSGEPGVSIDDADRRRNEAAALYLQTYPGTARSAELLVGRNADALMSEESAVKVLLGVPKESPVYERSRRQAARLLYSIFRNAKAGDRDFAAARFVGVAEEVLAMDRRDASSAIAPEAAQGAGRVVLRVRQILEAILGAAAPDTTRAESALAALDAVAARVSIGLTPHRPELLFRRFQIAMAKGDAPATASIAEELAREGGPYADAADRFAYRRALAAWQKLKAGIVPGFPAEGEALAAARQVTGAGVRIVERAGAAKAAVDASLLSVCAQVADAAVYIVDATGEAAAREAAVKMDRVILTAQPTNEAALGRVSRLAEVAGDKPAALDAWGTLLAGREGGTDAWFEAKYHVLSLLRELNEPKAREQMQAHKQLYPSYGPEPWGELIRAIDASLPKPVAAPAPGPATLPGAPVAPGAPR